jgi:hypothetical protein
MQYFSHTSSTHLHEIPLIQGFPTILLAHPSFWGKKKVYVGDFGFLNVLFKISEAEVIFVNGNSVKTKNVLKWKLDLRLRSIE